MAKLVAIGDSLTQGVMSGAISKTKLSYPALIADAMGLNICAPVTGDAPKDPNDFRVPRFPGKGLPLNIEELLRAIGPDFDDTMNFGELASRIFSILGFINGTQTSYSFEKTDFDGVYHNLAVSGFRVADSFTVNSAYCDKQIREINDDAVKRLSRCKDIISDVGESLGQEVLEGTVEEVLNAVLRLGNGLSNNQERSSFVNTFLHTCLDKISDVFEGPSASTYRIAKRVLNPNQNSNRECWTQICNLKHLAGKNGKGVENLILFFGANDCLGTVMDLEIKDMTGKNVSDDLKDRRQYNLTSEDVFKKDYKKMICQISEMISKDTKVFVGTIPHVTIPPITQRWGQEAFECNGRKYFDYYVPFFAAEDFDPKDSMAPRVPRLSGEEAKFIDDRIDEFNEIIKCVIKTVPPKKENWHLVDICCLLDKLAVRRTGNECDPGQPLKQLLPCDHALLKIDPVPSVLRFETKENERTNGGIFSLDCFHPATIGQGLIAEKFVCEMKKAGVCHVNPDKPDWELDWKKIIKKDTLIQKPPELWDDAINLTKEHRGLFSIIHRIFT